ncbi:MAG: hypothetical protein K2H13_02165 [Eubacterium sp.]|nr:hypothetical protein [Eubacterium sp.]MDE6155056.1 hypothetical protein [Eubacterium sp.]MDE6767530.1 hypothetical protein [Eubacterium sp.]
MQVDVTSHETGKTISKTIVNNNRLTEKELKAKLSQLEKIKIHPRDLDENKLLIARAESLYEECPVNLREVLKERLQMFNSVLSSQKQMDIKKAARSFNAFLDLIEAGGFNPFADSSFYDYNDDYDEDYDEED